MPYILRGPLSDAEIAVQRSGYPWVSTTVLVPPEHSGQSQLGRHKHHSQNTHLILRGQLTLTFDNGETITLDANSRDPRRKEMKVAPGIWYWGVAGPNGATFVEGHSDLSPTTERRFKGRGNLLWVN